MGNLLHVMTIPFQMGNFGLNKTLVSKRKDLEDTTIDLATIRLPKRPPRFFYNAKYLTKYSSMKAKL